MSELKLRPPTNQLGGPVFCCAVLRLGFPGVLFAVYNHEAAMAARQKHSGGIPNLTFMIQLSPLAPDQKTLDLELLADADRFQILDAEFGRHRGDFTENDWPCS